MLEIILLVVLFFIIAMIYSSAGMGGGSSYLAALSLFSLPFTDIRMIALACNIIVVLSGVWLYHKHNLIKWKKIWPLVLLSVPLAYFGGQFKINQNLFYILLSVTLIIAAIIMLLDQNRKTTSWPSSSNSLIGGGIGFLSGLVGIGGGILLSPLLHLTKWGETKVIAATTAVFILVNSISGLLGQLSTHGLPSNYSQLLPLLLAVLVGGQIGTRLSIFKLEPAAIKKITAIIILVIAIRIIFAHL